MNGLNGGPEGPVLRHEDGTLFDSSRPTTGHGLVHLCRRGCPICAARLDRAVLEIAGRWWRFEGAKAETIAQLGISGTRYAQILNRLIDDPQVLAEHPVLVHRLHRIRAAGLTPRTLMRGGA